MISQKFVKFLITLAVLSLLVAIPALAQGPGEEPVDNADESGASAAPADSTPTAPVEATDGTVDDGAQGTNSTAPDAASTAPVEQAGGAVEEFDSVGNLAGLEEVAAASDAQPSGLLGGSFSTEVIAIANTGGVAGTGQIQMSQIGGAGSANLTVDSVFAGGVKFFAPSDQGEWAGVLSTDFAAQVAVLTVNSSAKSADMYRGFDSNAIAQQLYGPIVYNEHAGWSSLLYCQNADAAAQDIKAELYQRNTSTPIHTFTAAAVAAGKGVKWDVEKDATSWTGGTGQFGFVKFSGSTGAVACVVDGQNSKDNWNASHSAVPTTYAAAELTVPLVYNGHGTSPSGSSNRGTKLNSGLAIVNVGGATTASVKFTAQNLKNDGRAAYEVTCTTDIAANASANWYTPLAWQDGMTGLWKCDKAFPLSYEANYNSFGTVKLTASNGGTLLAITNHSQNDTAVGTSAQQTAFSSLGVPTTKATNKVVCPLATKPSDATSKFNTGIRVANVGTSAVDVTMKFVKQGVDPSAAGNTVPVVKNIKVGEGVSNFLPIVTDVPAGFEGAVFIEGPTGSQILASANGVNDKAITAQGMYDCINY